MTLLSICTQGRGLELAGRIYESGYSRAHTEIVTVTSLLVSSLPPLTPRPPATRPTLLRRHEQLCWLCLFW